MTHIFRWTREVDRKTSPLPGERVGRDGAFTSRRGPGEGSLFGSSAGFGVRGYPRDDEGPERLRVTTTRRLQTIREVVCPGARP